MRIIPYDSKLHRIKRNATCKKFPVDPDYRKKRWVEFFLIWLFLQLITVFWLFPNYYQGIYVPVFTLGTLILGGLFAQVLINGEMEFLYYDLNAKGIVIRALRNRYGQVDWTEADWNEIGGIFIIRDILDRLFGLYSVKLTLKEARISKKSIMISGLDWHNAEKVMALIKRNIREYKRKK